MNSPLGTALSSVTMPAPPVTESLDGAATADAAVIGGGYPTTDEVVLSRTYVGYRGARANTMAEHHDVKLRSFRHTVVSPLFAL
jgi:hypothetical protein